ncbi:MAG: 50S ribosomal protein L6 [Candidatus Kerfeldbacteria bacterium]|nr:50S ribosomal protein L6 [Candidatus Kerfeldbacteria bacterium]
MSRLGKLPITVPSGVEVAITATTIRVKGPKGEVAVALPPGSLVSQEGQLIQVTVTNPETGSGRAIWGLARQLVSNAIEGCGRGFSKKLELSGVGYKVQLEGQELVLNLGFSHPIRFTIPSGISLAVEKNMVTVSGASKQLVGQVAAEIRALRKPEPYKGKGIKYSDEIVRRKAGKVVKAAGAK